MKKKSDIQKGKKLVRELSQICKKVSDDEIYEIFSDGMMGELLTSVLDPNTVANFKNIGDFFLANKKRAALISALRYAIQKHYSIQSETNDKTGYVSPTNFLWFEDGVIVLEGNQPFEGSICLYRENEISYAVSNRDAIKGDMLGVEDFDFIEIEKFKKRFLNNQEVSISNLDKPINNLRNLLKNKETNESKFQELFANYPWVLGLQYSKLQRHSNLDDENIPDFTGVKVSDNCRDIFELKPPTMKVFIKNGDFSSAFNKAWNQAERYLNFAREEKDYLNRKKYRFENPKCILVCGYNLDDNLKKKIRVKEKLNPSIQIMTYNDILAFMENTVTFIKKMSNSENNK